MEVYDADTRHDYAHPMLFVSMLTVLRGTLSTREDQPPMPRNGKPDVELWLNFNSQKIASKELSEKEDPSCWKFHF